MHKIVFLILLLISAGASAKASSHHCQEKSRQSIQNQALALYKKQKYKSAADLVRKFLSDCPGVNESLMGDFSLYLYKAGEYEECLNTFSSLIYPMSQPVDEKIAEAIQHNFKLCLAGREKALGETVKTSDCGLTSKEVPKGSIALPKDMLNPESKLACVGFENVIGTKSEDDTPECRRLVLIEKNSKSGQIKKTVLVDKKEDSFLNDFSFCCWIEAPALMKKDNRTYLYFRGQGRSCDGGTLNGEIMSVYKLDGVKLDLKEQVDIYYH